MEPPTDVGEVRQANLARVLGALDQLAPCSRTDLRAVTGLVSGSVSSIVDELVSRGLVIETGETTTTTGRGRPRRLLTLNPGRVLCTVVQLTSTDVIAEVRDLRGAVRWQSRRNHSLRDGLAEDVIDVLSAAVKRAARAGARAPAGWSSGTVIAVPGPVVAGRTLGASLELGIERVDLLLPLARRVPGERQITLMNDGRLGALAEYSAITSTERPSAMAYLTGGSGVSGGLVFDGEPYLGSHLMAGECGHVSVAMDGPDCGCGARGCLTLYLGYDGMLAASGLGALVEERGQAAAVDELLRRLGDGDARAIEVLDRAGSALATAIGTMSNYTDVDLVVLGGSLVRLERWLLPRVRGLLDSRRSRIAEFNPRVTRAQHGDDAPRIGAWILARDGVLRDPGQVPLLVSVDEPIGTNAGQEAGTRSGPV